MNRLRYGARITVAGVIAVLSLALMPSGVRADHEAGHDSMARGGIKALDEKVFDLQTSLANIELGGVSFSAGASSGTLPDDDFGFPFSTEFHDSQDDFEPALNGIPEPHRDFRRLVSLSQAAIADSSSC